MALLCNLPSLPLLLLFCFFLPAMGQPEWFSGRAATTLEPEASAPAQVARDLARATQLCDALDAEAGISTPEDGMDARASFANILASLTRAHLSDIQVCMCACGRVCMRACAHAVCRMVGFGG